MVRCTVKTFLKLILFTYIGLIVYGLTNYKSRVVFSQPDFIFEDSNFFLISNNSKKCKLKESELKAVTLDFDPSITLQQVAVANPALEAGGRWSPKLCVSWQNVMIIVPYRDREYHLRVLLNRLHPMLQKQKIEYQLFLANQAGEGPFARGRLANIAFLEALKIHNFDCVIMQVSIASPFQSNFSFMLILAIYIAYRHSFYTF